MELQAIVFGLLEELEFCPPASGELDEIEAVRAGGTTPFKKDKWEGQSIYQKLGIYNKTHNPSEGKQMPLLVRARK